MARHYQEREIDGQRWLVNEFPATEGLKVFVGLAKLVGGPLGKAVGTMQGAVKDVLDTKLDWALAGNALGSLVERLDEDDVVRLIRRMLRETSVIDSDGKKRSAHDQFDVLFQGRYLTMLKVVGFVAEVNFKLPLTDLLEGALAAGDGQAPPSSG